MEPLTPKQQEILNVIKKGIEAKGYPPTVREIGAAVKLSSSCTVKKHLDSIEVKGYIKRDRYQRGIELMDEGRRVTMGRTVCVPLLGRVAGGAPILATEDPDAEMLPVPQALLPRGTETGRGLFALEVVGDSMRDAGIDDGDIVIARQQSDANNGDIVVALIEDDATVKTFYREESRVRLQPQNPDHKPLYPDDLRILGKVALAIKRF